MSDDRTVITQRPRTLIVDEFSSYFGDQNDKLKEELREIKGVPSTAYLVKEEGVFVFDKLVQLVKEHQKEQPHAQLQDMARSLTVEELALSLLAEATVSAKEAVMVWGIVPVPYQTETLMAMDTATLEAHATGRIIMHRPFNARLPGVILGDAGVHAAFANLLEGGIHPGTGDFTYRGQPMTLRDPLDLTLLPARPKIPEGPATEGWIYTALGNVDFVDGFEPVSEVLFNSVKEMEAGWSADCDRALKHVQGRASEVWAQAAGLRLDTLNDPADEVQEYGEEEFPKLRTLYPELSMLSNGSLYSLFDAYQLECLYINGWTANRDDDFLFYLLGKAADASIDHERGKKIGEWVAVALLHGKALEEALEFGRSADLYNQAIGKLAQRIADAMRFLAEDKKATDMRGRPITTIGDTLRLGRKYKASPVIVQQKLP